MMVNTRTYFLHPTFGGLCFLLCSILQSDDGIQETRRTGFPVMVGGFDKASKQFLIIDTGSDGCLVDSKWATENLPGFETVRKPAKSLSGETTLSILTNVPVHVGSQIAKPLEIGIVDMGPFSRPDGGIRGVIGMSYLQDYVFEYSADKGCELHDELPEQGADAIILPLRNALLHPEIEIELPGLGKRWLALTHGFAGGISLSRTNTGILKRMGHLNAFPDVPMIDARGKSSTAKAGVLRWTRIGDTEFRNVPTIESTLESIGLELLRHFRMVLDFRRGQAFLYLDGKENVRSMSLNASGMTVNLTSNGQLGILKLREETPAADLGIRVGDEISRINSLAPKELGYWAVQDILGQAGKTIPLTVVRDGKSMEIQMPLRHSFPFPPEWPPEKPEFNPEP